MKKSISIFVFVVGMVFYGNAQDLNNVPTQHINQLTDGWPKFTSQGAAFDVEVAFGKLVKGNILWFDSTKYSGSFYNNKISGKGTYTWSNGDYYEGSFKNNQRHGKGTMHWSNGSKYSGKWKKNQKYGKGKLYDNNGAVVKEGVWEQDLYVDTSE